MLYPTAKITRRIATHDGFRTTMDAAGNALETKRVKAGEVSLEPCVMADTESNSKAEQVRVKSAKDKQKNASKV